MESFGCLCYLNVEQSVARRPALGISECFSVRVRAQEGEKETKTWYLMHVHIRQLKAQSYKFRSVITLIFSPTFRRRKHTQTDVDLATWGACMHPQRNRKKTQTRWGEKQETFWKGFRVPLQMFGVHGGTDPTSARHRHRQFVTHKKTQDFLITVYI